MFFTFFFFLFLSQSYGRRKTCLFGIIITIPPFFYKIFLIFIYNHSTTRYKIYFIFTHSPTSASMHINSIIIYFHFSPFFIYTFYNIYISKLFIFFFYQTIYIKIYLFTTIKPIFFYILTFIHSNIYSRSQEYKPFCSIFLIKFL